MPRWCRRVVRLSNLTAIREKSQMMIAVSVVAIATIAGHQVVARSSESSGFLLARASTNNATGRTALMANSFFPNRRNVPVARLNVATSAIITKDVGMFIDILTPPFIFKFL